MIVAMVLAAASAAWLHFTGKRADRRRLRQALGPATAPDRGIRFAGLTFPYGKKRPEALSLVVLVQQFAALLRGGRGSAQLWEELWLVHAGPNKSASMQSPTLRQRIRQSVEGPNAAGAATALTEESKAVLAAARAASAVGASPAAAIRSSAARSYPRRGSSERRVWMELAACLEVAETSGCPLADLLTRFAAQLVAEEDAEAARQTALAGPKATVKLLSWLPVLGLVLGMALGVDPVGILLQNIVGVATFGTGIMLTVAGRVWSSRLVAAAAGGT